MQERERRTCNNASHFNPSCFSRRTSHTLWNKAPHVSLHEGKHVFQGQVESHLSKASHISRPSNSIQRAQGRLYVNYDESILRTTKTPSPLQKEPHISSEQEESLCQRASSREFNPLTCTSSVTQAILLVTSILSGERTLRNMNESSDLV